MEPIKKIGTSQLMSSKYPNVKLLATAPTRPANIAVHTAIALYHRNKLVGKF